MLEQGDCFVYLAWFCPPGPIALMESIFSTADVSILGNSYLQTEVQF